MIITSEEFNAIIYATRQKAIGTAEGYKQKPFGLLLLQHKTIKSKSKSVKIPKHEYNFILHECSKYLETLKNISNFRMNKDFIEKTIETLSTIINKIKSYDDTRGGENIS